MHDTKGMTDVSSMPKAYASAGMRSVSDAFSKPFGGSVNCGGALTSILRPRPASCKLRATKRIIKRLIRGAFQARIT